MSFTSTAAGARRLTAGALVAVAAFGVTACQDKGGDQSSDTPPSKSADQSPDSGGSSDDQKSSEPPKDAETSGGGVGESSEPPKDAETSGGGVGESSEPPKDAESSGGDGVKGPGAEGEPTACKPGDDGCDDVTQKSGTFQGTLQKVNTNKYVVTTKGQRLYFTMPLTGDVTIKGRGGMCGANAGATTCTQKQMDDYYGKNPGDHVTVKMNKGIANSVVEQPA